MFMKPFQAQTYALFRIVVGLLFFLHGTQKIFGFPPSEMGGGPAFIVYGAGGIELVAGFMIMIGLFTPWAAFLSSGLMAVAYWMAHGLNGLTPLQNGGELAVVYCFAFLFIAARGAGIWSVDALISREKPPVAAGSGA